MNKFAPAARAGSRACAAFITAGLAACTIPPAPTPPPASASATRPAPGTQTPVAAPSAAEAMSLSLSTATTPLAYRRDAARHLYSQYQDRIFQGKMPPLLHAVGVLQVELNAQGKVTGTSWMRMPSHAPEVVAEIEQLVRKAAPYPVPVRMGKVVYTDTWLWDKSGKFQLDTLTEGQF